MRRRKGMPFCCCWGERCGGSSQTPWLMQAAVMWGRVTTPGPGMGQTSTPSLIQWQSQESQWGSFGMCPLSSWRCAVRHSLVSSVPWAVPVPSLGTLALKHSLWSSLARWDGRGHALLTMGLPSTPATHTPQLHSWGLWGVAHTDMTDSSSTKPLCRWRTQM